MICDQTTKQKNSAGAFFVKILYGRMFLSLFHKYIGLVRSAACYYLVESLSVFLIRI